MKLPRLPLMAAACLLTLHADDVMAPLGNVTAQWVATRDATVKAQAEWDSQRDLLQASIDAMRERAQTLEEQRDLLQARTTKNREDLAAQERENAECRQRLRESEQHVAAVDAALLALRPQLPPRLSAALAVVSRSLADPSVGPSERMQLTLTFLTRCEQFNHTITAGEEVLAVEGESRPRLLDSIYWGTSVGYAYDRTSGRAWLGRPSPEGWRWEPCPQAAAAVRTLLDAGQNQSEPQFVSVAAQIGH